MSSSSPARCLEGVELKNNWKVIKIINPPPEGTGGCFSVGYLVKNKDGKEAYLKALDFSKAFQSSDPARELQIMTTAYNFERDLLKKCKGSKLKRVVIAIDDGYVNIPSSIGGYGVVHYIIFEKAKDNVRNLYFKMKQFDLAWCLRTLHNTAVGIMELHLREIAHQDLKPSNVLFFENVGSKITDLGRATDKMCNSSNDQLCIPGDQGYAPPEQFYNYKLSDDFQSRMAADLYMLGSMIYFYFSNISAIQALKLKLKNINPNFSSSSYVADLPYLKNAFYETIIDLENNINIHTKKLSGGIIDITKQLCEPDVRKRGHPKNQLSSFQQYGLERIISKLDILATAAEWGRELV